MLPSALGPMAGREEGEGGRGTLLLSPLAPLWLGPVWLVGCRGTLAAVTAWTLVDPFATVAAGILVAWTPTGRERREGRSPSGSRWLGPLWPVVIQTFASTGCTEHSQHVWLMMIFVFVARPLPENGCRVTYRHVVLTTHVSFSVLRNKGLSASLCF